MNFRDTVFILGAGPLGLGMIQAFTLKNHKKLIVLDLDDSRLTIAKELGTTTILNPKKIDVIRRVKEMISSHECDI